MGSRYTKYHSCIPAKQGPWSRNCTTGKSGDRWWCEDPTRRDSTSRIQGPHSKILHKSIPCIADCKIKIHLGWRAATSTVHPPLVIPCPPSFD